MIHERFEEFFGRWPRWTVVALGITGVAMVGVLDTLLMYELSLTLLYLVPIVFVSWLSGRRSGFLVAALSGAVYFTTEIVTRFPYSIPLYIAWNTTTRLLIFLMVAALVSGLRTAFTRLQTMALSDALTGLDNSRSFLAQVSREIARARRSGDPLTVAYLDLDDFKRVNDTRGHSEGDRLLREIGHALACDLRPGDAAARLGGDEFALLFPGAGPEEAASIMTRLSGALDSALRGGGWHAGVSMGVVTFKEPPPSEEMLLHAADELMYEAKAAGKGRVLYRVIG